ncbi:Ribokinase-like protein [Clavulina sp. PMI_390]|nr:Ribokinase-like protein [Clavulina sp. PMI_390]
MEERRVLSIQSHVVSGYVGNKAATFPLQVLGYDVDAINTVQYTNHSGYHRFGGTKTTADEMEGLFSIMRQNGMIDHPRLLTGFIPNAAALQVVVQVAEELRSKEPEKLRFIYLLDPVMGDDGRMYVAPDVLPIYRDILLPLATIITPNWYEAELLTGVEIRDVNTLRDALRILHLTHNVPYVVITSLPLHTALADELVAASPFSAAVNGSDQESSTAYSSDRLLCVASSIINNPDDPAVVSDVGVAIFPRIRGYFSGVGDLFSALVVAHFRPCFKTPQVAEESGKSAASSLPALGIAVENALATTQAILLSTHAHSASLDGCSSTDDEKDTAEPNRRVRRMRGRELRIVQGLDAIRSPPAGLVSVVSWPSFWQGQ